MSEVRRTKAYFAKRARHREEIMESERFRSGEPSRTKDYARLIGEGSKYTAKLLGDLYRDGLLNRELLAGRGFVYFRRTPLMRMDWRHDHEIYEIIERERRGW